MLGVRCGLVVEVMDLDYLEVVVQVEGTEEQGETNQEQVVLA